MKIAVAQINTTVGDFSGNTEKILDRVAWGRNNDTDLMIFPELAVCGYPPRDLVEHRSFVSKGLECVERIAKKTKDIAVILGSIFPNDAREGRSLFNSAVFLCDGSVKAIQHKSLLPQYDVFDEARYFEPSSTCEPISWGGKKWGLTICEDLWAAHIGDGRQLYRTDPVDRIAKEDVDVVVNISASPVILGKGDVRRKVISDAARRVGCPVVYCNAVGGNDELIFDGQSCVVNEKGELCAEGERFVEDSFFVDLDKLLPKPPRKALIAEEELREMLVLGLRDYMRKCGFTQGIVGISGGIDSAVVAALAAEAIGAKNVTGVIMPSPYTAEQSIRDATALAKNLGIVTELHRIDAVYETYRRELGFSDEHVSLAEENLQARIRGSILMALSNRTGALVLSTGNKSELSVGYCTLYGDMVGGLSVIADVPKTMVYRLAHHINRDRTLIPESIVSRAPTAELKPNQKDQDVLPDYTILDAILKAYIEDHHSVEDMVRMGLDEKIVRDVVSRVDRNEYKRRQAAPGFKVTSKAFGVGRRFPIAWRS